MKRGMKRGWFVLIGTLALVCSASTGWAGGLTSEVQVDRTRAHVVTRDAPPPTAHGPQVQREILSHHHRRPASAEIVHRRVVAPAATVSRELSEQPVLPHLAEVIVGSGGIKVTTERARRGARTGPRQGDGAKGLTRTIQGQSALRILVDPEQDLRHLDRGHYLRRAQVRHSHWLNRQAARPARVIRHPLLENREAARSSEVRPRAILRAPDAPRPRQDTGPGLVRAK